MAARLGASSRVKQSLGIWAKWNGQSQPFGNGFVTEFINVDDIKVQWRLNRIQRVGKIVNSVRRTRGNGTSVHATNRALNSWIKHLKGVSHLTFVFCKRFARHQGRL